MSAQQIYSIDRNKVTDLLDDYLIKAAESYMNEIRYGIESCVNIKEIGILNRLGDIICNYDDLGNKPSANVQGAMQYINTQALSLENGC